MESFRKVCLVGTDRVIGSFALGLKRTGYRGQIVAVAGKDIINQMWLQGLIKHGTENLAEGLAGSDLIIIAPQSGHAGELFQNVLTAAEDGATISEMTRVKGDVNRLFEVSGRFDLHYVGFRLLTEGSETESVGDASKFFFEGRTVILTPRGKADLEQFSALQDMLRRMGAKVVAMSPQAHDKVLAQLSQVPKTAIVAILQELFQSADDLALSPDMLGKWLLSETRELAAMKRDGWVQDIDANRKVVLQGMDNLIGQLKNLKNEISDGRLGDVLDGLLARTGSLTEVIPTEERSDLIIVVGSETKTLERVAEILAKSRIKIGALDKMEYAEPGTYRISLGSGLDCEKASSLLKSAGLEVAELS